MAAPVRVQKALADAGLMSRRAAEEAIRAGRVAVDGAVVRLGDRVDVDRQQVTLDGVPVPLSPETETYLLYKPVGVISSAHDPEGRPTVVDLIDTPARVYPVGRLDYDSEGLILVSNDGELANRVTHPRYRIEKKYLVVVRGRPRGDVARRLRQGVELDDGPARAVSARMLGRRGEETMVELVVGEGRNREIRRMFEALGLEVTRLVRTAIGPIADRSLRPGQYRRLSPTEVKELLASGRGGG